MAAITITAGDQATTATTASDASGVMANPAPGLGVLSRLRMTQAVAKTATFQVASTAVGFAANYVFVRSVRTATVLSGFGLAVGPALYFAHESVWNYVTASRQDALKHPSSRIAVPLPWRRHGRTDADLTVSREVAKTITWRSVMAISDFSIVMAVVGNVATAAALTATGLVVGTCVYFGHERAWDLLDARNDANRSVTPGMKTVPIPSVSHGRYTAMIQRLVLGRPVRRPARMRALPAAG